MIKISVIIPTLNETGNIADLSIYLNDIDNLLECIVSDGGSSDDTVAQAKSLSTVVDSAKGRGAQMNAGAAVANGDILWFIHADCRPHKEAVASLRTALTNVAVVGGAFEYNLKHPSKYFRLTEYLSNKKNRRLKLIFGDMGIFVRSDVFKRMNGYAETPLMEDMEFCSRLKQQGDIVILPQRIDTSIRRWEEEGWMKNVVRNWILQAAWKLGVSPERLARWYTFK